MGNPAKVQAAQVSNEVSDVDKLKKRTDENIKQQREINEDVALKNFYKNQINKFTNDTETTYETDPVTGKTVARTNFTGPEKEFQEGLRGEASRQLKNISGRAQIKSADERKKDAVQNRIQTANAGTAGGEEITRQEMLRALEASGLGPSSPQYQQVLQGLAANTSAQHATNVNDAQTKALEDASKAQADQIAARAGENADLESVSGLKRTLSDPTVPTYNEKETDSLGAQTAGINNATQSQISDAGNRQRTSEANTEIANANSPQGLIGNTLNAAANIGSKFIPSDSEMKIDPKKIEEDPSKDTMKELEPDLDPDESSEIQGALEMIRQLPQQEFMYKPGSKGDDGGKKHMGGMAQTTTKVTGTGDSKTIDVGSMIGLALKGIQELDKKVNRGGKDA